MLANNAPTHPSPLSPPLNYTGPTPVLTHIKVYYLPPNTTAFLQPLDGGIIASFVAIYRRLFAQFYVDHFNTFDKLAPKLDALQAIYRIAKAWDLVPPTIFHCWQKVGIISSIDYEFAGTYKKCLQDIQVATISVASMLILDPTTDELQDHVSILDQVWIKLQLCG